MSEVQNESEKTCKRERRETQARKNLGESRPISQYPSSGDVQQRAALPVDLSDDEQELLREIIGALRALRFGTVTLTVHEGRLVEIQKTERIRRSSAK